MTLVPEQTYETAQPGDDVYLGSVIVKLHLWGQVSDLDTPAMMSGSMEVLGDDAALVLDALVGPRGPAGAPSPIVKMQWSESIRDPNDLPKNLLDDPNDRGKAWWIGNQVFVWDGFRFQIHAMGSQGPAGPIARVNPSVVLLDPDGVEDTSIDVSGTTTHPSWQLRLKVPKGPPGPAAAIRLADDYDDSEPMEPGKVLTVLPGPAPGSFLWGPRSFVSRHVRMFTVPEGSFQNYIGLTQRHTILAYTIEPQPFDYVPYVMGHIKAIGLELDVTPLQIGVEVRLGSPTGGQLIGRGHGSIIGWNAISPHFSTPGDPNVATSPSNQVGMVPAGQPGEIFLNLFNDGLLGAYIFNRNGAQISILTVPTEMVF